MTGNDILERALDLCALHSGEGDLREDLQDLRARAPAILNTLIALYTPLSARLKREAQTVQSVKSLEESIRLHPGLCGSVLPFALAALLIADEDRELSEALSAHAREARAALLADGKSACRRIVEVYG